MIHQVFADQEMSLLTPPGPWCGRDWPGLGGSVFRKRQLVDSINPPSAAPWVGWREEGNPLAGQAISLVFDLYNVYEKPCLCAGKPFA